VFVDSAAMASVCTASVSQATLSLGAAKAVQNVQNGKRAFLGQGVSGLSAPRKLAVRSFCVRAGGAAPKQQIVTPINNDPYIGFFETPVTSTPAVTWFLSNLPGYRIGVDPLLRGVEVGLAHGFLLAGPFIKTGPLRNSPVALEAGSLAAGGLVVILSVALTIYGLATFQDSTPEEKKLTLTGRKLEADPLQTAEGWSRFTGGFFFAGLLGAGWAYYLLANYGGAYPV